MPSEPPTPAGTLAFLCGADMNPLSIADRPGLAGARFVAIASMEGSRAGRAGLPVGLDTGEIWGIVLSIPPLPAPLRAPPPASAAPSPVPVVLRDGTAIEAVPLTGPKTAGTVVEILAQAHYWELPLPYRDRLQAVLIRMEATSQGAP